MTDESCILTTGDFSALKSLQEQWTARDHRLTPALRRKLDSARIVFQADLPPDIASLGSQIAYAVEGEDIRTHVLTCLSGLDDRSLPISLALGLALLGRREGSEVDVDVEPGRSRRVRLHRVVDQPEAVWPGRYADDAAPTRTPALRLVGKPAERGPAPKRYIPFDDDPGPTAA